MKTKEKIFRIAGIVMIVCGLAVLSFFAVRKIRHELYVRKLLKENINFEIPSLHIRIPVVEGTDDQSLQVSAGHFEGTGGLGSGNYCIAGHNSVIYDEVFNDLDQIQIGDEMYLVDNDENRTKYLYVVTEYKIVEPNQVDILRDFGDTRITVVSCTDDGSQRQVVVGTYKKQ